MASVALQIAGIRRSKTQEHRVAYFGRTRGIWACWAEILAEKRIAALSEMSTLIPIFFQGFVASGGSSRM